MLIFENYNEIVKICEWYDIKNYHINPDGTVDVDGDVDLSEIKLTKIPLNFGRVSGHFQCPYLLTTLEGAPKEVGGDFDCRNNQLTTLEGAPKEVGGNFYCTNNQLTSLEGSPNEVGGHFYCYNNKLTSLQGSPKRVGRDIYFLNNALPEKILKNEKYIKDIFYWQDEYRIWKSDGTLNEFRFDEMMIDIRNDWKEGNRIE
jgi:hypothetical protein